MMVRAPIAIGGVGGSGTRVVAALLQRLGHFIGSDLNPSLDNLWFTLLFKRRSVLLESNRDFTWLCDQFWLRMSGVPCLDGRSLERIADLAMSDRPPHSKAWLQQRMRSWMEAPPIPEQQAWGWKEPNTHVVIDHMLDLWPELRYIHVLRNPLDMAFSANQNQLNLWGPVFLDRPVTQGPRDSLSYCCTVARRIQRMTEDHPGRICTVNFERLCNAPHDVARQVANFINAAIDEDVLTWFSDLVGQRTPAIDRHQDIEPNSFAPDDLNFVATLGYEMEKIVSQSNS
ncbi:sulfotransferase [Sphingobium sp. BYY-5]|uniref:sulfotransferase n=1 Tax=Sphingobium sp. BYY-5 TaxID=2926400 RepID=UPI001FA7EB54|nr:sulfotransferase [Sphingobium sp. BYY-5]MCI4590584.1 sulfotransferase [Sphingobium sp. BYY-5]